jgi:hypothetical protein
MAVRRKSYITLWANWAAARRMKVVVSHESNTVNAILLRSTMSLRREYILSVAGVTG